MRLNEKVTAQPLAVYDSQEEAWAHADDYASLCRDWGITESYRVKVQPMERRHTKGTWGVWLVKHTKT